MSDWQTLSTKIVYETPWIRVRRDEVTNHAGKHLTYSVVELRTPSVFIVAMNAAGQVFLQQSYRYTLGKTMLEIPAGHSDGEDLLVAAKRELLEEAGLTSEQWTNLGKLYQADGIGNLPFIVFLAQNVQQAAARQELDEDITKQRFIDPASVEDMILNGELTGSAHIAAIYLTKLYISKHR